MAAFDSVRTLLNIRRKRERPLARSKPTVGARLAMGSYRIIVQAGLSDELWRFLVEAGFREVTYRPDRRRYRDVPPSRVTSLYNAPPEDWKVLLLRALKEASRRPLVRVGARSVRVA